DLLDGTEFAPIIWNTLAEGGNAVPWYGAVSALPGFNLDLNEVAYFGGVDCKDYLSNLTGTCNFTNPGEYWQFGTNPSGLAGVPAPLAVNSAANTPKNAGMASARGTDDQGNVILVAWGGKNTSGTFSDTNIYYQYLAGGTTRTWQKTPVSNGP